MSLVWQGFLDWLWRAAGWLNMPGHETIVVVALAAGLMFFVFRRRG